MDKLTGRMSSKPDSIHVNFQALTLFAIGINHSISSYFASLATNCQIQKNKRVQQAGAANMKALFSSFLMLVTLASYSEAKDLKPDLKPLESKTMINGYCYAGSREDDKAPGGYGPSDNAPKKITGKISGSKSQITLLALPNESLPFSERHLGFRLLLINRTSTEASFPASDSRLNIICEALNQSGEWKSIEMLSASFCGNSYHNVYLPSGCYWEFSAPVYNGTLKTKLRYKLQGMHPIYSNEFDGAINPAQFKEPTPSK